MKPPSIAVVTPAFPPKGGGVATAHYNLFRLLSRVHETRAFAYDDADPTPCPEVVRRKSPRAVAALLSRILRLYLRRFDREGRFDLCARTAGIAWGAWRLGPALRRFKPDIALVPDTEVPAYFIRWPAETRVVWHCHHNYLRFRDHPLLDDNWWSDIDVSASMERRALRKAHAVVSPSAYMEKVFRQTCGRPDLPLRVIPNFIDSAELAGIRAAPLRATLGLPEDTPVVYFPSAGTVAKGKRHAFEIVRRIGRQHGGNIVFFLSGAIPDDLAFELRQIGPPVTLHAPGNLPWSENMKLVAACDLVVSPALVENFSSALVEAHALGKPVVAFDTGGNREIVQEGRTGFVVPYLDVDALVARAAELLADVPLRSRFGQNAREWTREALAPDRILQQYQSLFAELLG